MCGLPNRENAARGHRVYNTHMSHDSPTQPRSWDGLLALLALICAGCAGLKPAQDGALLRASSNSPGVSVTPVASAQLTAIDAPEAQGNQTPGGEGMTQTVQTRGQFELVGGQGLSLIHI